MGLSQTSPIPRSPDGDKNNFYHRLDHYPEKPVKHKLEMGKLGTAAFIMFCSQNLWPDDQISKAKHIGNVLTLLCSFFLVVLLESFLWIVMCSI